jgi:O-antigen/teichoic acid export membrane protein
VSAQVSYLEPEFPAPATAAAAPRPSRAFAGAGVLSGAMVLSGVLTYAFLVVAARSLGPTAYGRIGVLWAAMFIVAIVVFRPLEQTLSRSIADRRARGEEVRTAIDSVVKLGIAMFCFVSLLNVAAWMPLTRRLFQGDSTLTALLLVGVALYGASYLVRGLVGGVRWFNGYAVNLVADGAGRLTLCLPLLLVVSTTSAAVAVVGAGLLAAVAPLVIGRRRLRPLWTRGPGEPFRTASAVRFAVPAGVIAASDQLLVNGAPLLVVIGGGPGATKAAGIVFAATMLVRAPVYVFQGAAAALLPNLTSLNATDGFGGLQRELRRAAPLLFVSSFLIVAVATVAGPFGMNLLYGHEYAVSRVTFAALGAGVGFYIVGTTFSQALLAVDAGRRAAVAWTFAGVSLVVAYVVLPGSSITRVAEAFAVASFVLLLALGRQVFRPGQATA